MAEEISSNTDAAGSGETAAPQKETLSSLLDQMSSPPAENGEADDSSRAGTVEHDNTDDESLSGADAEHEGEERSEEGDANDDGADADEQWVDDASGEDGDDEEGAQGKQGSRNFRGRWDHLSAEERRVVELTTKRGLSLDEAYRAVYGEGTRSGGSQEEAESQEESSSEVAGSLAATDEAVATAQRELEELEAKLDDDDDPFEADPAKRRKIQRELREKTVALAELKAEQKLLKRELEIEERQRQAQTASQFETGYQTSVAEAERTFPDLAENGTPLREAVEEEIQYLVATKSPLLNQPDFPLVVARRMARSLGVKPAGTAGQSTAGASKPQNGTPAVVKNTGANKPGSRGIRPLPAGGSPVELPSLEQRAAGAKTSAQMLELMKEFGTPIAELARR